MADVLRIPSFYSPRFSSSLLTSFASTLNSLQPPLQPPLPANNSDKRIYPLVYSSAGGVSSFAPTLRKQLLSFKVPILALYWALCFFRIWVKITRTLLFKLLDCFVNIPFFCDSLCCEWIFEYPSPVIVLFSLCYCSYLGFVYWCFFLC